MDIEVIIIIILLALSSIGCIGFLKSAECCCFQKQPQEQYCSETKSVEQSSDYEPYENNLQETLIV